MMRSNSGSLCDRTRLSVLVGLALVNVCAAAPFREYPIGDEIKTNQLKVAAVYLPPVTMDSPGHDHADMEKFSEPGREKIHLEADIHASEGNVNGFAAGDWVPYLTIKFKLKHVESGKTIESALAPMVAKDGPHYGATVRMMGAGKYTLLYRIETPVASAFGRHTDEFTGVAPWWKPFEVRWDFEYKGLPK